MTPDLGQGGCQALEDAVVLGQCLKSEDGLSNVLRQFESRRLRRVRRIVRDSHSMGRVFAARNRAIGVVRDLLIAATPEAFRMRRLAGYASRDAFLATTKPPPWA
jgi:2-polyprenyl-6-methoxyphenol hydroxylase-like FAD-dependent oxidoreductase